MYFDIILFFITFVLMRNTKYISGIYRLTFSTGHFYIGKSTDINSRVKSHHKLLAQNKHPNKPMQKVYNETRELPTSSIILLCENNIVPKENIYINEAKREYPLLCLNVNYNRTETNILNRKEPLLNTVRYKVVINGLTKDQFRLIKQKYDTVDNALLRLLELDC